MQPSPQQDLSRPQASALDSRLNELRHKLLDLSARNKLLNFRHTSSNCIRAVDELPGQLFARLLRNERLVFDPVPAPTHQELRRYHAADAGVPRAGEAERELPPPPAEEWAKQLGIATRYELPVDTGDSDHRRHQDDRIQTLLYPDDLEARLGKLRSDARMAIEESGANMLYVVFGFLEWREQDRSEKAHLAPLVLVPVELSREGIRNGRYRYAVSWTGEDLQSNLSLKKKLEADFSLALPDFDADANPDAAAEDYFDRVHEAVRDRANWRIRRFVSMALFHFGKLLIYLDLDPANWTDDSAFGRNAIVRQLLLGDQAGSDPADADPEPIDPEVIDLGIELVDRADSSQATAVARALEGRSMVVQGPPGTGKSQTITNLIAAAMARGRTVLFVAEKLAALQVVQRRLEELGLSQFCLELHSHKTRKQALIEELRRRLEITDLAPPHSFEQTRREFTRKRAELTRYAAEIARPVGALGWPASRVLFKAGAIRRVLGDLPHDLSGPEDLDILAVSESDRARARGALTALARCAGEAAGGHGLKHHPWAGVSSDRVLPMDAHGVAAAAETWAASLRALDRTIAAFRRAAREVACDDEALAEAAARLARYGGTLRGLEDATVQVQALAERVQGLTGLTTGNDIAGIRSLHAALELARAAPVAALGHRSEHLWDPLVDALLADLSRHTGRIRTLRTDLGDRVDLDTARAVPPDAIADAARQLARRDLLRIFSGNWRAARRLMRHVARFDNRDFRPRPGDMIALAELRSAERSLEADADACKALGPAFAGAETPVEELQEVRSWYRTIEERFGRGLTETARLGRTLAGLDTGTVGALGAVVDEPGFGTLKAVVDHLDARALTAAASGGTTEPWAAILRDALGSPLGDAILRMRTSVPWDDLLATAQAVATAQAEAAHAEQGFARSTDLDRELWFAQTGATPTCAAMADRVERAARAENLLEQWLDFDRAFRQVTVPGARDLAQRAFAGEVAFEAAADAYDHLLFDGLARHVLAKSDTIRRYGLREHADLRAQFRALDETVMDLRRVQIAADLVRRPIPNGQAGATVGSYTDLQLLRHETAKQKRHVPIRALVRRAGRALQAVKPCFMMGPLSVAQYLPPGDLTFDLVIFDEASQVRPEDAIGTLARGRQAVIVGDSRQLPPTNFFNRMNDSDGQDSDDGEDVGIGALAESILEMAEGRLPRELLRWHYRSNHTSLIAFSNARFYDGRLMLFPSPHHAGDHYGLGFHYIADGAFTKGRNRVEADRVAAAAVAHLRDHPNRSLGVVAMNMEQRDLIRQLVDRKLKEDPLLLDSVEDFERNDEPFFVKNLENVQGDERDVIMISMTYGPSEPRGKTAQRFGPINGAAGWRRLNVLFTRAKDRMEIFSSMHESDINISDAKERGPRELKAFLHYAETDIIMSAPEPVGRPMDSDFEAAVYEGLTGLGYDCDAQVGAAGYYIDLAVRDPDNPGLYLLGVECDGATYHSTRSARDRDRLRQDILEDKLKWTIERVWSTDWFRNPDRELERLRASIEAVRERRRASAADMRAPIELSAAPDEPPPADPVGPQTAQDLFHVGDVSTPTLQQPHPAHPAHPARPNGILSQAQARRLLIDLREQQIARDFPKADQTRGLLRKGMIDELLRTRPTSIEEFQTRVRLDLRENTDSAQLKAFGDTVFDILDRIAD